MSTPHNEANLGDIAKTVIMPGDPLRAKYIAENFMTDTKLVNSVRGIYAYTGKYKDKEITVMASGMGMPSMGIYSYELYKFYNVENIIRIGSCGSYKPELKLFDIVLAENTFSEGNFALTLNNDDCHIVSSNDELNSLISEVKNITKADLLKEKYEKIRQIFNEQKPYIGLYNSYYAVTSSWSLKGNVTANWYNIFINIANWYKN